eukprot:CAMPEP_0119548146 /NCGR_PEP_ID=MMETSP1352-20130426/2138_1 /TAXON_ID=265584 /ORGANISM="Stauroneis constricta, Strain CCMP1120" /LENGTH=120 /DNA_ID=CAMNT_0007593331 /DNA_START=39 /DNA_END=401 /DNA_ORIENTATION=-
MDDKNARNDDVDTKGATREGPDEDKQHQERGHEEFKARQSHQAERTQAEVGGDDDEPVSAVIAGAAASASLDDCCGRHRAESAADRPSQEDDAKPPTTAALPLRPRVQQLFRSRFQQIRS